MKPSFALDPSRVIQLLVFAPGVEQSRRFVVKSLGAAGEADEMPDAWRIQTSVVPEAGVLLGAGSPVESSRQLSSFKGATITSPEPGDRLKIRFSGTEQQASFRPLRGKRDLVIDYVRCWQRRDLQ
jgi:hypothetical protein